jgi:hypothetical protein
MNETNNHANSGEKHLQAESAREEYHPHRY